LYIRNARLRIFVTDFRAATHLRNPQSLSKEWGAPYFGSL
jgi:hypothetical protein